MTETARPVALVTGAGVRLGRAIALGLAADGYAVAAHCNASKAPADALVAEIEAAGGRGAVLRQDLADLAGTRGLVDRAEAALGPVTLLVNSASRYGGDRLEDLTADGWRTMLDVNATAPILLMQAFAAAARAAPETPGTRAIVNLLDTQLAAPSSRTFSYFCSKAALESATRMAALELAPDIRVNAIAPGLVLPSGGQTDAEFAARQALTPLGGGLAAQDIVEAVRYLARARHVTGETIAVDSGQGLAGFGNAEIVRPPR